MRSAQAGVDLVEHGRAGAERGLAELIERRLHGVAMGVKVFCVVLDVEEAGDDLAGVGGDDGGEILAADDGAGVDEAAEEEFAVGAAGGGEVVAVAMQLIRRFASL